MIGEGIGTKIGDQRPLISGLTLLIGPGGSPAPPRSCSSGSSAPSSAHPSTVAGTPSPRHPHADPPPPMHHPLPSHPLHPPQHPFLLSLPSTNHPLVSPPNSLPTHSPQNPDSLANKKCPRSDSPMRPKSSGSLIFDQLAKYSQFLKMKRFVHQRRKEMKHLGEKKTLKRGEEGGRRRERRERMTRKEEEEEVHRWPRANAPTPRDPYPNIHLR